MCGDGAVNDVAGDGGLVTLEAGEDSVCAVMVVSRAGGTRSNSSVPDLPVLCSGCHLFPPGNLDTLVQLVIINQSNEELHKGLHITIYTTPLNAKPPAHSQKKLPTTPVKPPGSNPSIYAPTNPRRWEGPVGSGVPPRVVRGRLRGGAW